MAEDKTRQETGLSEDVAQNPGARTATVHEHPEISNREASNANSGEAPNAAGGTGKTSTAENHVPSSSSPEATDLPTANTPDPDQASSQNPNAS
jgi:hypothetical protein